MFEEVTDPEEHEPSRPAPPGSPRPLASAPGQRTGAADHHPPPGADGWSWPSFGDDPDPRPRRRRPLLVLLAVAPWIVVAVTLLRPTPAPAGTAGADGAAPAEREPTVVATVPAPAPASGGAVATVAPPPTAGGLTAPTKAEAGAVAARLAQALLGDQGPRPPVPEGLRPLGVPGYLDHLLVESIDHPAPGAAVVTVVATLLQGDRSWERTATVRLAVPLRLDEDGARGAGQPWRLPVDLPAVDPVPPGEPVDDPVLLTEAGAALAAAGYGAVEARSLRRTDSWPWVLDAVAVAPDATAPSEHVVWLRPHLGGFVLAGSRPVRTAAGGRP